MPGLVRRSAGHRKVRICERLGAQFPGPTRPQQTVNPPPERPLTGALSDKAWGPTGEHLNAVGIGYLSAARSKC